jgi:hypothetical protein
MLAYYHFIGLVIQNFQAEIDGERNLRCYAISPRNVRVSVYIDFGKCDLSCGGVLFGEIFENGGDNFAGTAPK